MPQVKRASKHQIKKCKEIHAVIDELLPGNYVEEIQTRLKNKGIEESEDRIYRARALRLMNLDIMNELLSYCREITPEEFDNHQTGLVKP